MPRVFPTGWSNELLAGAKRPLLYAPLDNPAEFSKTRALPHGLLRTTPARPLFNHPSATYAKPVHPTFLAAAHINNSTGAALRWGGLYGRTFPQRGTIQFWIRPATTLANYDGVLSTNADTVDGNNKNKIKSFKDGTYVDTVFCNSGNQNFDTISSYAANTRYLTTITWDFGRSIGYTYINNTIYTHSSITQKPYSWRTIELGRAKRDGTAYTPDAAFNGLYISEQFTSFGEHRDVMLIGKRWLRVPRKRFYSMLSSGVMAATSAADAVAITALLRAVGVVGVENAIDAAELLGIVNLGGIISGLVSATNGLDVGAYAARVAWVGRLSATDEQCLAAVIGKVVSGGAIIAGLADDELVALARAWPTMYDMVSGIAITPAQTELSLGTMESVISGFGDTPLAWAVLPDLATPIVYDPVPTSPLVLEEPVAEETTLSTFPPIVESTVTMP